MVKNRRAFVVRGFFMYKVVDTLKSMFLDLFSMGKALFMGL